MSALTANFRSVVDQIAELRENYPDAIALRHGDRQLSYEELDRGADRFAGHLAQLGIASGGAVAICMERSFDWIIAALGIMRAGAAYVPLDPAWPDARLRIAVRDSGATVLVARAALLDRLQVEARGVDPYRDAVAIASATEVPRVPLRADSLAYVIYTSGSTGVPKGVEIAHANLAHLVGWYRDTFRVTRQDRASHLIGLGFDASVLEIWAHLCAGATLCLAEDAVRSSPELIQQWMVGERITIGVVPTVLGARLLKMAWPTTTALRLLVTGGDELRQGPTAGLPFEVVNQYGPTECTVVSTWALLKPGSEGVPPIGHPIAGATVYLLNELGEPVPDGAVGEIFVGGACVGRGYRNLPDFTARSFLPDPFSEALGARMYRTGDRGTRRADGEIEFRGRLDRQTKIRGQRVELDEIDSILSLHPSIEFASVIVRISEGGENQLVAYVLPKENVRLPTVHELQQHLLGSLPDYMIPAVFARLHALPISVNGKLDLNMLEPPTDADLLEGADAEGPAAPIKEKLLAMVRELLENEAIAAKDNFFLAGGHSLLGMQFVMRLRNTFGVDLALQQLFEAPTVERLALLIEVMFQKRLALIWAELLGRKCVSVDDNFFDLSGDLSLAEALQRRIAAEFGQFIPIGELSQYATIRKQTELAVSKMIGPALPHGVIALQPHGARNSIFWIDYACAEDLALEIGEGQPVLAVVLTADDYASLGEAPKLESIAACLLRKILAVQSTGPYIIGGFCLGGIIGYEIASQMRAAGHEVSLVVLLDAPNPTYLDRCNSLSRKVSYLRYVLRRAVRLGPRTSFVYLRERLPKRLATSLRIISANTQMRSTREKMNVAARAYQPKHCDGKVLLLLASERPPHVNFVPGWQAVVPLNLHTQYVDGHHRDIGKGKNIRGVAHIIVSHLMSAADDKFSLAAPALPGPRSLVQMGNPATYRFDQGQGGEGATQASTPLTE